MVTNVAKVNEDVRCDMWVRILHYFGLYSEKVQLFFGLGHQKADGVFNVFEMKWNVNKSNAPLPKSFLEAYPVASTNIVTPENYLEFLIKF